MKCVKYPYVFILIITALAGCGAKVDHETDFPWWLSGYEELYRVNPREAAQEWFGDAGAGLFVHFNLASLCENGKWDYVEFSEGKASDRLLEFVGIPRAEYESARNKDSLLFERYLIPNFSADEICELAVAAKMSYVTLTTLHLGRIYNFNTATSTFNSMNAPGKKDLVEELAASCKKYGLALFLYVPPEYARTDPGVVSHNREVLGELLSNYGPIGGIWFDGIGDYNNHPENYTDLEETYSFIRSLQPHCLISFKEGTCNTEDIVSPEHYMPAFKWDFDDPVSDRNECSGPAIVRSLGDGGRSHNPRRHHAGHRYDNSF